MSIHRYGYDDKAIFPHDRAEPGTRGLASGQSPRRLVSIRGSNIFMASLMAAATMGLTRFAGHLSTHDQSVADRNQPGAGIIVGSEVLDIWLPPVFIELANDEELSDLLRTHDDLRRFLELRDQKSVRYALTVRGHLANGTFVDMRFVRQPYDKPSLFPEFLETLAMAPGRQSGEPGVDVAGPSVHVWPQGSFSRIRESLERSAALYDDG